MFPILQAAYRLDSKWKNLVSVAASHHRLVWIHPFLDGNGRVARLISHAMLKELGLGSTLWSVSRGLARSIADYKTNLMAADEPRQGDLDGRGNLSRKNLIAFCEYFLSQCLDQVRFMERLVAPSLLSDRIRQQILEDERSGILASGAHRLRRAALEYGEVPRGDVPAIVQASERTGQRITKSLIENGSACEFACARVRFAALEFSPVSERLRPRCDPRTLGHNWEKSSAGSMRKKLSQAVARRRCEISSKHVIAPGRSITAASLMTWQECLGWHILLYMPA